VRATALLSGAAAAAAVAASAMAGVSVGAGTAAAQAELGVRIELTEMSPRLVTADGPGVLTVAGRVSNDGDRTIRQLDVRVQRGEPLGSEDDLLAALSGEATTDAARPRFVDLPDSLGPRGSMPFRVDIPLRGGDELDSLLITELGVYPLLVNLNGRPDFGGRARLASVRLLLPVLGLPATGTAPGAAPGAGSGTAPGTAPGTGPGTAPGTGPGTAAAVLPARIPLTVVWPLVDVPHRLPPQQLPAADGAPAVVLRDDSLARSLAPQGRLHGLVQSALQWAPPGSPLGSALCVAVDPDLVDTVRLMAEAGYLLADGSQGTGRQAAVDWLRSLRELAAGHCVLALPFADVDLVALSRAGLTDLQGRARTDGAQILREALGVGPATELAWPAGEVLDERTLTDLASLGTGAVLLRRDGLADPASFAGQPVLGLATGAPATASQRGVLVDALLGQALSGTPNAAQPSQEGQQPGQRPGQVTVPPSTSPAGTGGPLSAQDGLAALAFRATSADPAGVLVAPPRRWAAGVAENAALLGTAARLLADGWAQPRAIGDLTGGAPPLLTGTLNYPGQAGADELATSVTATITGIRNQLRDLEAATRRDPRVGYDPARLLDPIRFTMLRGASSAWRGQADAARWFVQQSDSRLRELRESVEIVPPGGPYLLAASNSPLLLNLNNPLPVQIDVQITLSVVAGLRTGPVDVISLPAGSRRQVRVPAEVIRAGSFSVAAQLATPGGTRLGPRGEPSRIQLRSTAYGTVTLVLTGTAAVALVLLAGLRITRRVRAARRAGAHPAGAPAVSAGEGP